MFKKFGKKMRIAAIVFMVFGVIASLAWGISVIQAGAEMDRHHANSGFETECWGVAIILGFSFLSWLGAMGIYGFGQIVDNIEINTTLAIKRDSAQEESKKE